MNRSKEMPKVSLVIPVYNGEKYISKSLESALNQTYKNIEIIVVNDGSKDASEEIIKHYGDKIKYIKKENGGVSTALNLALKEMTGDYFSWLSHDDLYYPTKIEEEVNAIEDKTIVMSDYDLIDEHGKLKRNIILPHEVIEEHNEFALYKGLINGITLLIPKKAFEECGEFDENLRCTQDYDMWFKMLLKGYKFKHLKKVLASSRQHSKQVTNTSPKMLIEGNRLWIDMMEQLPLTTKENINKSEYNFYREMSYVLKETPYQEAYSYCIEKMQHISNEKLNLERYKISIIMPFYDEPISIIKRALNSTLNQTHKNIEVILINDNPNKYSEKELKEIINNDKVKYIKNEMNLGVSASRNKGINLAKGDYIAFLDSDDEFLNNKLSIQLKELLLTKENFSHTSYIRKVSQEEKINSGYQNGIIYKQCIYSCGIATPTVMIKKEFLEKYNLRFNEKIHIGEDTCFWLDILQLTSAIGIEEALTKVYIDESSAAYNVEKQIEGLKNILTYVVNQNKLQQYNKEIALLARNFANITLLNDKDSEDQYNYDKIVNSLSWRLTKPFRLVGKTFSGLKNEGLKETVKRIKNFLKKS